MNKFYSMVEVGAAKAILRDIAVRGYEIYPQEWGVWASRVMLWFNTYLTICRKVRTAIGNWNMAVSRVWSAIKNGLIRVKDIPC